MSKNKNSFLSIETWENSIFDFLFLLIKVHLAKKYIQCFKSSYSFFMFQVDISSLQIQDWTGSVKTPEDWKIYVDTFLMMVCGGIPWQPYYQRALAVKSTKNAQILSVLATLGCFFFMIPPIMIGGAAKAYDDVFIGPYNVTENPSMVLPASLATLAPYWASILGLSAVR